MFQQLLQIKRSLSYEFKYVKISPMSKITVYLIEILGEIRASSIAPQIAKYINSSNIYVQESAIRALGKIGYPSCVRSLTDLYNNLQFDRVIPNYYPLGMNKTKMLGTILEALSRIATDEAVQFLIEIAFNHEDMEKRNEVIEYLNTNVKLEKNKAIQLLSTALDKTSDFDSSLDKSAPELVLYSVVILEQYADPSIIESLIPALNYSRKYGVQAVAAKILGSIGNDRATELLTGLLDDTNLKLQDIAIENLLCIRNKNVVKPLVKRLKICMRKKHSAFRKEYKIVTHLVEIGSTEAAESVIDWLLVNYGLAEEVEKTDLFNKLSELLGDYGAVIMKAFGYEFKDVTEKGNWGAGYKDAKKPYLEKHERIYSLEESNHAIKLLCDTKTRISSNILHKISQKNDREVFAMYEQVTEDWTESENTKLSFQYQRTIATQELQHRGYTEYDPSAYLDKNAWKL